MKSLVSAARRRRCPATCAAANPRADLQHTAANGALQPHDPCLGLQQLALRCCCMPACCPFGQRQQPRSPAALLRTSAHPPPPPHPPPLQDDPIQIQRALEKGEERLREHLHPDPYIGA